MYCIVSAHEPHCIIWTANEGQILGYSMAELRGRSVLMLCGPCTDSLLFFTAISQASVLKTSRIPLRLRDKDGRHRCCLVTCSPAVDCAGQLGGSLLSVETTELNEENNLQSTMNNSSSPQLARKQGRKQAKGIQCFDKSSQVVKARGDNRSRDSCRSIAISELISAHEISIVPGEA